MVTYRIFTGTQKEYDALHHWVRKSLGRPSKCENCNTTKAVRYHWANISGEYLKDLSDWARLCPRCHMLIDNHIIYKKIEGKWSQPKNWGAPLGSANSVGGKRHDPNFCMYGHPFSGDNLYMKKTARGIRRVCRACSRNHLRALRKRRKDGIR